jgi:hypothetical protein
MYQPLVEFISNNQNTFPEVLTCDLPDPESNSTEAVIEFLNPKDIDTQHLENIIGTKYIMIDFMFGHDCSEADRERIENDLDAAIPEGARTNFSTDCFDNGLPASICVEFNWSPS